MPGRERASTSVSSIGLLLGLLALSPSAGRSVVDLPDGFASQELATLTNPVGFAFLPDGRILIVENKQEAPHETEGWVYLYAGGDLSPAPVLVLPDVNTTGNERGLLGVAVDPDWPARPYAYFHYCHQSGANRVRMYEGAGDLSSPVSLDLTFGNPYDVIVDLPDQLEWHNGGTLRFGPDKTLFVSQGDDATDQCANFQDPSRWYGVILRLDVSALPGPGSGPPAKSLITPVNNPFPGPDDNARLTYAIGFRNPFRFNIDPLTGTLYVGDVGEASYEELDEVVPGGNYGWPMREGAHDLAGTPCSLDVGIDPIAEIAHSGTSAYSIISGPRYRPRGGVFDFPAAYGGDLFYCEFYSGVVRRLRHSAGSWAPAPAAPGQPSALDWAQGLTFVSDLEVGPDGALYYVRLRTTPVLGRIYPASVATPEALVSAGLPSVELITNPIARGEPLAVRVHLATAGKLSAALFDAGGRRVATWSKASSPAASPGLRWDLEIGDDPPLAPGAYFLRVTHGKDAVTKRVTFLP